VAQSRYFYQGLPANLCSDMLIDSLPFGCSCFHREGAKFFERCEGGFFAFFVSSRFKLPSNLRSTGRPPVNQTGFISLSDHSQMTMATQATRAQAACEPVLLSRSNAPDTSLPSHCNSRMSPASARIYLHAAKLKNLPDLNF